LLLTLWGADSRESSGGETRKNAALERIAQVLENRP